MKFVKIHLILTVFFLVWAIAATLLLFKNPLPFPDRGHRAFGVRDERARQTVIKVLGDVGGMKERFTFDSGASHQTILWDGFTSINYVESEVREQMNLPGNGLSVPVGDPTASALKAIEILQKNGYTGRIVEGVDLGLPPNHLVLVESNAFDHWLMVFRLPLIDMPKPKFRE